MRRVLLVVVALVAAGLLFGLYVTFFGRADMCNDAGGSWSDSDHKCFVTCQGRPLEVREPDGGCFMELK